MNPMGRYIAASYALAKAHRQAADAIHRATTEYQAALEAITAAGVNDMNEGKEG